MNAKMAGLAALMSALVALLAALGFSWLAPTSKVDTPVSKTDYIAPAAPAAPAPPAPVEAPVIRAAEPAPVAPPVVQAPAAPLVLQDKASNIGAIRKVEGGFVVANARGSVTVPAVDTTKQIPGNVGSVPQTAVAGNAGNAGNAGAYLTATAGAAPQAAPAPVSKEIPGAVGNAGTRVGSLGGVQSISAGNPAGMTDAANLANTASTIKAGQLNLGQVYKATAR